MKKQTKKNDKFTATEVGVLLETIRSEIKPILEDIPSIKAKLDSTYEQVGKNTEVLSLVGIQIKSLQEKAKSLEEKVGENTKDIHLIKDILNEHSQLLNRILEELKSKVDRKEFEILEKKVASLAS